MSPVPLKDEYLLRHECDADGDWSDADDEPTVLVDATADMAVAREDLEIEDLCLGGITP